MFKVKIVFEEEGKEVPIYTKMPIIPKEGEYVGFWHMGEWHMAKVGYVVYELDKSNNYSLVEINIE